MWLTLLLHLLARLETNVHVLCSLDFGSHQDLSGHGYSLSDGMTLPPALGSRRDGETARNHDLYKTAITQDDGLFHCPWEGDASCNHKPEKLKCNYEYVSCLSMFSRA